MPSTAFRRLLAHSIGASLARQHALADLVGEYDWRLDLAGGTLDLGHGRIFPVQVLGTESDVSRTWLWAWANRVTRIPDRLLRDAERVRELGVEHRVPELVEPELSLGAVEAWRLAAVATGLCGADAFFRGDHEHGAVYLLLHDTPLAGPLRSPAERVVAVLADMASAGLAGPRSAVEAYLEQEGMSVVRREDSVSASDDGRGVSVSFDQQGRIGEIAAQVRPPE